MFPLLPLALKVLLKIQRERVTAIVILPYWLEVERGFNWLGSRGPSSGDIITGSKRSTIVTYNRIWNSFHHAATERGWDLGSASVSNILEFLQSGHNKGSAYNSLKGQISALLAMLGTRCALHPLVI